MKISGWLSYVMESYSPVCKLLFHLKRKNIIWAKTTKILICLKQGKVILMKLWTTSDNLQTRLKIPILIRKCFVKCFLWANYLDIKDLDKRKLQGRFWNNCTRWPKVREWSLNYILQQLWKTLKINWNTNLLATA